jgi:Holliday junction resolvase-like predicted endonuclease
VDRHQRGALSEAVVATYMIEHGWLVYTMEFRATGPIDLVCLHPGLQTWLFLDVKSDKQRMIKHRRTVSRIHRVRSPLQKALGVHTVYVTRAGKLSFSPRLPEAAAVTL